MHFFKVWPFKFQCFFARCCTLLRAPGELVARAGKGSEECPHLRRRSLVPCSPPLGASEGSEEQGGRLEAARPILTCFESQSKARSLLPVASRSQATAPAGSGPKGLVKLMAKEKKLAGTSGAKWPKPPSEGVATYEKMLRTLMTQAHFKALADQARRAWRVPVQYTSLPPRPKPHDRDEPQRDLMLLAAPFLPTTH